jgi:hypothetical protein
MLAWVLLAKKAKVTTTRNRAITWYSTPRVALLFKDQFFFGGGGVTGATTASQSNGEDE